MSAASHQPAGERTGPGRRGGDGPAGGAATHRGPGLGRRTADPADPFVSPDDLLSTLRGPTPPVLLDVRHSPDGGADRAGWEREHLPGAVFVDLTAELAGPVGPGTGSRPLPPLDALQRAARGWGLRRGGDVVVYDDRHGLSAARAWWLLRWGGHRRVRILEGGLARWRAAGGPLTAGAVRPMPGDVQLTPGHLPVVDIETATRQASEGELLDARRPSAYRSGHIPGALNLPAPDTLTEEGSLRERAELEAQLAAATGPGRPEAGEQDTQRRTPVVYCGSGVSATFQIAVLRRLGVEAALYPGSWSQWSSDPGRPVSTAHAGHRAAEERSR